MADLINEKTTTLFWAGLAVGFLMLVGGGIASATLWVPPAISLLVIAGGLSIILGAFGATATLNYQGVALAGVAALCVVLFYIVVPEIRNPSARVVIKGFPRDSAVDFYAGGTHFLGALRGDHHDIYEFAVFADELKANVLGLTVTPPKLADGSVQADIIFDCIDRKSVSSLLGSSTAMQWMVDLKNSKLVTLDKENSITLSGLGDCTGEKEEKDPAKAFAFSDLFTPIRSAVAAPTDVAAPLRDLTAESSAIRTDARRSIGAAGPAAIRPLMDNWKKQPGDYRVRLGSVVSLVEMMRAMKPQKTTIRSELDAADLHLIGEAAIDQDRTVRIYASEFLYDLADPRTVPIAFELMPGATGDGQYNLALILTSVAAEMSGADRTKLKQQVSALDASKFGDKTRAKLAEI